MTALVVVGGISLPGEGEKLFGLRDGAKKQIDEEKARSQEIDDMTYVGTDEYVEEIAKESLVW